MIRDYLKDTNIKDIDSFYIIKTTGMDDIQIPIRVKFRPDEAGEEKLRSAILAIGDILIG